MLHSAAPTIRGVKFYGQWTSGKKLHRLPRHKNPGLEIVLVSKGELRWEVEGRPVKLGADMLFYTLPWQAHGGVEEMQPSSEISYVCVSLAEAYTKPRVQFGFHRAFGFSKDEERAIASSLGRSRVQALAAGEEAGWLFARFFQAARGSKALDASRARDMIKLLILDLANRAAVESVSSPRILEAERRVRKFTQMLATRFAESWSLEDMSRTCGLKRTQFAELLKKLTGDTPVTYLNRLRVQEAQRLMRESNKSITEIALEVGFNSSQYFATVFKGFTDLEAREFRKESKGSGGIRVRTGV